MVAVERRSSASHPDPHMLSHFGNGEDTSRPHQDIIPVGLSSRTSTDQDYQWLAASTRRVPENQHTEASTEVFMRIGCPVPLGSTAALPSNYGSIRGICVPRIIMAKL